MSLRAGPRVGVVLDTDVLIDYLRGVRAAGRYVDGLDAVPTCSEVTRVEVLRGMRSRERRVTERFLATIRWSAVDGETSRLAGELGRRFRRSYGAIGVADLVIAATAVRLRIPLATLNVRHFPMFENLEPAYRRQAARVSGAAPPWGASPPGGRRRGG